MTSDRVAINNTYCKIELRVAKEQLREKLGTQKANKLIRENMDVMRSSIGGSMKYYTLHWVADGDVIKKDIWREKKCHNIDHARSEAIGLLIRTLELVESGDWNWGA
jgi:hypothetical protein